MNAGTVKRVLFGLMLIGFGFLFLASQMGFIHLDWGDIISTFWPVILIFVGLSGMASTGRNHSGLFWNGFVALLGVMFLLRNLGLVNMDWGDLFKLVIPAAIILYGIKLILGGNRGTPKRADREDSLTEPEDDSGRVETPPPPPPPPPPFILDEREEKWGAGASFPPEPDGGTAGGSSSAGSAGIGPGGFAAAGRPGKTWQGTETRSGFIGDIYLGRDYWELKPLNVSLFIGDTVIDLTKARIPYGETKLTVSAFIGDVKVLVPGDSDISFKINSSSFIGDIQVFGRRTSGFLRSIDEQMPDYAEADKKVFLQCSLFIGDIQIMRVG